MAGTPLPKRRRPPRLYRTARTFRRLSAVALVLIVVFVAVVAFSALQVVRTKPGTGNLNTGFAANDTIALTGAFTLGNSGYFPISDFSLHFRVLTQSDVFLGATSAGPVNLPVGQNTSFPISLYFPLRSGGPAESLLTVNQYLEVFVWANATYGYLFPVSLALEDNKTWGAPFSDFQASVGSPYPNGSVPVTLSYQNGADLDEAGTIDFAINSTAGATCGTGAFPIAVPSKQSYQDTQTVAIASGCSLAGATLDAVYLSNGVAIPLPPETLP